MRNVFISYHHRSDYVHRQALQSRISSSRFFDYGFKEEDLREASKMSISKKIQSRLWSSSVVVVLVGNKTGESSWIDWELWYSLQDYRNRKIARRRFKPKGLLAVYLPVDKHHVPKRLQRNIDSGYAVKLAWEDLESGFESKVEQAYKNRVNQGLIENSLPLQDDPRKLFGSLSLRRLFSI